MSQTASATGIFRKLLVTKQSCLEKLAELYQDRITCSNNPLHVPAPHDPTALVPAHDSIPGLSLKETAAYVRCETYVANLLDITFLDFVNVYTYGSVNGHGTTTATC